MSSPGPGGLCYRFVLSTPFVDGRLMGTHPVAHGLWYWKWTAVQPWMWDYQQLRWRDVIVSYVSFGESPYDVEGQCYRVYDNVNPPGALVMTASTTP